MRVLETSWRGWGALLLAAAVTWCAGAPLSRAASAADTVTFGPHDVRSMFYVAKSENQNQVHYALRVDESCKPAKSDPVFAYWSRVHKGLRYDEPLLPPGTRLYGPSDDPKVTYGAQNASVRTYVKALKKLPIDVTVQKVDGACKTTSSVTLKGERARLSYAFIQLGRFGLTVKYVNVVGIRLRDGAKVVEQFE